MQKNRNAWVQIGQYKYVRTTYEITKYVQCIIAICYMFWLWYYLIGVFSNLKIPTPNYANHLASDKLSSEFNKTIAS